MGKMKSWPGYCPDYMSWNTGRLEKGLCTEWQHHLYNSWRSHGYSKFNPNAKDHRLFISVFFAPCFCDFRCFVNVIKRDPMFSQFCQNPSLYDIDKDGLYKEWSPRSVQIVTKQVNHQICFNQNGAPLSNPSLAKRVAQKNSISKSRYVECTTPLGNTFLVLGESNITLWFGIPQSTVSACIYCHNGSHTIKRGSNAGWSFEFV